MDLFQIISTRIYDLEQKYVENGKILAIIKNKDENFVMKQQAGVLIAIIGNNAKQIEEEIDKAF